ncbi:transposase [bacterium]|nr:transposase [bacterium]
MNKQENSNKFGKAIFHGNNREFQQSTKEEQLIAEGCKRLIENAIICWNYLYLSQQVNTQGEYDFSDECLKDSVQFELDELLSLNVA